MLAELASIVAPLTCMIADFNASLTAAPGEMPLPDVCTTTFCIFPTSGAATTCAAEAGTGAVAGTGGAAAGAAPVLASCPQPAIKESNKADKKMCLFMNVQLQIDNSGSVAQKFPIGHKGL
jgi:hypothetical protein